MTTTRHGPGFTLGEILGRRLPPCEMKERHRSRGAAEAAIRSLRRRDGYADETSGALKAYYCPRHHAWHTGRERKES